MDKNDLPDKSASGLNDQDILVCGCYKSTY